MHTSPLLKTLAIVAVVVATLALSCSILTAGNPLVRLRASVDLIVDAGGVREWLDPVSGITATVGTSLPQPTVIAGAVNSKAALSFSGNSFLTVNNADCFKGSYTIYVVLKHNGVVGSNNIVSGNQHALWLSNTNFPHVLHNSDFAQQGVSNVALNGCCVLRVLFDATTGRVKIAVNNVEGASTIIPPTNDPTFLIGAFAASNFYNGEIAEVVYYHGVLSDADRIIEDNRLHTFYGIVRTADPPPAVVVFSIAPKHLQLIPVGDSIRVDGFVVDPSVLTVDLTVDSNGVVIDQRNWIVASNGPNFVFTRAIPNATISQYRVAVTASRSGTRDTVLKADSIINGIVLAISGQSNSVFGDPLGTKAPLARTFGSNFSSSAADTAWSLSDPRLYGRGSTVGAAGMYLQNHLISQNMPSAVINGGVGGTTIQQHLPNTAVPEALTTIHGSWAYRRRIAQVNKYINWMYWYQGESNNGEDDYAAMFDSVYNQWHREMPNLKHIIVVQIRPGCGGTSHALLREKQRVLQQRYADVAVIAAGGLPEHDGCHYGRNGYIGLGTILAHHLDSGGYDGSRPLSKEWSSPDIASATFANEAKTMVRLRFRGYASSVPSLRMTAESDIGGSIRTHQQAFFADGNDAMTPQSVLVDGDEVILTFLAPVSKVSYIPSMYYAGTAVIYEGPWLTNARGVGALTFHDYPVSVLSGIEEAAYISTNYIQRIVDIGETVTLANVFDGTVRILDMRGAEVHSTPLSNGTFTIPPLASAPYLVVAGKFRLMLLVR